MCIALYCILCMRRFVYKYSIVRVRCICVYTRGHTCRPFVKRILYRIYRVASRSQSTRRNEWIPIFSLALLSFSKLQCTGQQGRRIRNSLTLGRCYLSSLTPQLCISGYAKQNHYFANRYSYK